MIIGIDLHGVIDDDPDGFKYICTGFTCWNCSVYIISGPPEDEIEEELKKYKIYRDKHYGAILSVVDHLKEKGVEMWQDERERWWLRCDGARHRRGQFWRIAYRHRGELGPARL